MSSNVNTPVTMFALVDRVAGVFDDWREHYVLDGADYVVVCKPVHPQKMLVKFASGRAFDIFIRDAMPQDLP